MWTYDPDEIPELDPETLGQAKGLGLHPIHVICDEPNSQVGDHTGVSFVAFSEFLPRVGDSIDLEDGTVCEVRRVYHKLARNPETNYIMLVPNVFAVRIGRTNRAGPE
jgi:hypothetical protein